MSYFSNSLKDLYENFPRVNTLTTGCTDVIVSEDENKELKCTPFNIRIPVLNEYIEIYINNELNEIKAKTDDQGICYFEEEYDIINKKKETNDILNKLKEKWTSTFFIKRNDLEYSTLPIEHKLFLEKININVNRFEEIRKQNYLLRSRKVKPTFYSLISNNKIKDILNSSEHILFLSRKSNELYFYLKNYRNKIIKRNKECNLFSKTCFNFEIQYSNCEDFRGNILYNFYINRVLFPLDNLNKLIIRIKTCKLCRIDIYLPFILFSEFDHIIYLLNGTKSERSKFQSFLDKLYYKSIHLLNNYKQKNFYTSKILSSKELIKLNLKDGINEVIYSCIYNKINVKFNIFKININSKIVISDIDGTITKSDVWGNLYDYAGKDYTHSGIAKLFSLIESNGYLFIYLSSRPFSHYNRTKLYLNNIYQDSYSMPKGAIFLSVSGLLNVIYTEVIKKSPHVFKISTLCDLKNILKDNSFKAGFGNKLTDSLSYKNVGIPNNRIFNINSSGVILLNSGISVKSGYNSLQGFVNAMFPADKEIINLQDFDNYNYWK